MSIGDWDEGTLARFIEDAIQRDPVIALARGLTPFTVVGATNAPPFQNGWSSLGGEDVVAYYMDRGRVYLKGTLTGGTISAAAFTLPSGWRAAAEQFYPAWSNGAIGHVRVQSSGAVIPTSGSNAYIALDGISFRAVQ